MADEDTAYRELLCGSGHSTLQAAKGNRPAGSQVGEEEESKNERMESRIQIEQRSNGLDTLCAQAGARRTPAKYKPKFRDKCFPL